MEAQDLYILKTPDAYIVMKIPGSSFRNGKDEVIDRAKSIYASRYR